MEKKRLNTSDIFKSDHATGFRSRFGSSDVTTLLHVNGSSFSSSYATRVLPHSRMVEVMRVHTAVDGSIQGLSYSFREALGAPLFSAAIVEVSAPSLALGPYVSDKELKASVTESKQEETAPAESQSFLRKYWWVIAGFFLMSSFLGSGAQEGRNAPSSQGPSDKSD